MTNNNRDVAFWVLEEELRKMELGAKKELQPKVKRIIDDCIVELLEGERKPIQSLRILRRRLSEVL